MDDEDLRLRVYTAFAATGRAPDVANLAAETGAGEDAVRDGLRRLAAARHLVLDQHDKVVMAHPFTSINLGFTVSGTSTLWWGGCAWDSFAIPRVVAGDPEVLVATRCPACDTPHSWVVGRDAPPDGEQVAHFLVPAAQMWDDVVHTCRNQRLFCSEDCIDSWLRRSNLQRGYVLDLGTLWRLAAHWYDGRMDRGYVRRDPPAAAAYFRSVGLSGPFWGL